MTPQERGVCAFLTVPSLRQVEAAAWVAWLSDHLDDPAWLNYAPTDQIEKYRALLAFYKDIVR